MSHTDHCYGRYFQHGGKSYYVCARTLEAIPRTKKSLLQGETCPHCHQPIDGTAHDASVLKIEHVTTFLLDSGTQVTLTSRQ